MRKHRLGAAFASIFVAAATFVACGGSSGCAIAAPTNNVVVVTHVLDRGSSGGSGSSGASSSGSSSSGASSSGRGTGGGAGASGSSSGGASGKGSGGGAGASGATHSNNVSSGTGNASSPIGSGSVSGSRANTYTNPATHTVTHVYIPATISSSYGYGGHTYYYHPESYWMHGPLDPNNPFDTRNYNNPFSPFYHSHMQYTGGHC